MFLFYFRLTPLIIINFLYNMQNHEKDAIVGDLAGTKIAVQTAAGAAWVKKVLHPPTSVSNDYCGTPDSSNPNVVLIEVKGERNVSPLIDLAAVNFNDIQKVSSDAMFFLIPSGGYVAAYVFHRFDGKWYSSALNGGRIKSQPITVPAVLNSGYNFANLAADASLVSTSYKSTTFYLNATDFTNQGTITTAKFKPDIVYARAPLEIVSKYCIKTLRALHDHCSDLDTNIHDNDIIKMRAFLDNEEGDLKYGVFDHQYQILNMGELNVPFYQPNNNSIYYNGFFPSTPSDLMMISPKATTRLAKEGSFVVQQTMGPVRVWNEVPSTPTDPTARRMTYSMIRGSIGSQISLLPLVSANVGPGYEYSDTPWSNLDWAAVMVDGLSAPSSDSRILSSAPYITVKSFTGIEIQPRFLSSLLCFQRLLPKYDPVAIEFCNHVFHGMLDGQPASANDQDSIMHVIRKYLPSIIESTKDIYGSSKNAKAVRPVLTKKLNELAAQISNMKVSTLSKQRKQPLKSGKQSLASYKRKVENKPIVKKTVVNKEKPQINTSVKRSKNQ